MTPDHVRGGLSSDAGATSSSISSPTAPSPMPTFSNAPSLTLSPASTTSDNLFHRPISYGLPRKWSVERVRSCGLGPGFEGDLIAEAFEAALEIGNGAALTDLVEIGVSEIAIDHAPGEHVIGGHDDLVSNGQGGTQRAATGLEAMELVPQIAAFGARRGNGGADQDCAQMHVALTGTPALLLACALIAAGANAGPGGKVVDAEEDAHVGADFGDDDRGDQPIDPGDGHQQGHFGAIGQQSFADPRVEGSNIRFDRRDAAKLHREQEAVMLFDAAGEGLNQLGALAAQLASGEGRDLLGRAAAGDKRPQHGAAGDAEDVAHHARQLDVGRLQQSQKTVAFRRLRLDALAAIAQQLA